MNVRRLALPLILLGLWLIIGLGVALRAVHDGLPPGGTWWQAARALCTGSWDQFTDPWLFFAIDNQKTMLTQSAIVAVAASGMTLVIVAGGIDLGVGSVIALAGVAAALGLKAGLGPVGALALAMGTGALTGLVNGTLVAGLRLMPFIATLGMLGAARGTAKLLGDSQSVNYPSAAEGWLSGLMLPVATGPESWSKALHLAPGIYLAAGTVALMHVVLARSVFGRHVIAVGSNEAAARLCGVRVQRTQVLVYTIAGALFGLAGLMEMTRLHQGDPTTAAGRELDVIAAVVIGGASLSGGVGTVLGAVLGALIMTVLRTGTQQLDWPTPVQEILIGSVIVAAAVVDRVRRR